MRIIPFQRQYRDDMIFMVLEAKNALGRIPHLNEDLLDIDRCFIQKGDMFWLALDDTGRVIGCIGYHILSPTAAKLQRLYVQYTRKRQGIGTKLLETAEGDLRSKGIRQIRVHLGDSDYWESKLFYPARGYRETEGDIMTKEL